MTLLTDEVRAWIGREAVYEAPEEVGRASIRYFAVAIGDDNPLYVDDEFAKSNGYPSVIAPPTFVCETNQFLQSSQNDDGYLGHTWDLPVQGCRLVRGGNEYEFVRPLLPGDRVRVTWRLRDISERTSSNGAQMLIVSSEATYESNGDTIARNTETLIYQAVAR